VTNVPDANRFVRKPTATVGKKTGFEDQGTRRLSLGSQIRVLVRAPAGECIQAVDLARVTESHVMVPMRDGKKLSTYLYTPEGKGPWPVLYRSDMPTSGGPGRAKGLPGWRRRATSSPPRTSEGRSSPKGPGSVIGPSAGASCRTATIPSNGWARQPWSSARSAPSAARSRVRQNFLAVTRPPHLVCQYMIDTGPEPVPRGLPHRGDDPARAVQTDGSRCRNPRTIGASSPSGSLTELRRLLAEEDCTRHFEAMDVPCFTVEVGMISCAWAR